MPRRFQKKTKKKCVMEHGGTLPDRDGKYHPSALEFLVPKRKMYI